VLRNIWAFLSKVYLYYLHSKNIEYFEKLNNLAFENIL
jgi:hypothetical protein